MTTKRARVDDRRPHEGALVGTEVAGVALEVNQALEQIGKECGLVPRLVADVLALAARNGGWLLESGKVHRVMETELTDSGPDNNAWNVYTRS